MQACSPFRNVRLPLLLGAVLGLAAALKDPSDWVRRNAAKALGQIGRKAEDAVPALEELVGDGETSDKTREYAEQALKEIQRY